MILPFVTIWHFMGNGLYILWAKVLRSLRTDLVKDKERHLGFNIGVATRCHWSTLSFKARYKIFELLPAEQEYLVMNGY